MQFLLNKDLVEYTQSINSNFHFEEKCAILYEKVPNIYFYTTGDNTEKITF